MDLSMLMRWNSHQVIQRLLPDSEANVRTSDTAISVNSPQDYRNALKLSSEKHLPLIFRRVRAVNFKMNGSGLNNFEIITYVK